MTIAELSWHELALRGEIYVPLTITADMLDALYYGLRRRLGLPTTLV